MMDEFQTAILNQIEIKMEAYTVPGDAEVAHGVADELLITLIKNLATDENRKQVRRIVEAYRRIEKWYA